MRAPLTAVAALVLMSGCDAIEQLSPNLFTIEDDIELGAQLAEEIASKPKEYGKILDPDDPANAEAYDHLQRVTDAVIDSEEIRYRDEFVWQLHIIDDDEVLNAFAAPGGYIYVYTGLIHYLEVEDHFAGVMGHEIAHADQRHSTQQLTKAYGVSTLLGVVFGSDPGVIAQVASGLLSLQFSRTDEAEADEFSVYYLCDTDYAANGTAGFFEKLSEEGGVGVPEFLSTHPSPDNRVEDINNLAEDLGCSLDPNPNADWDGFKSSLP